VFKSISGSVGLVDGPEYSKQSVQLQPAIHIGHFGDHPAKKIGIHSGRYLLSAKSHRTVAGPSVLLLLGGILSIRNA
jgi:hypothetical protein